jgi:hypothetical protein
MILMIKAHDGRFIRTFHGLTGSGKKSLTLHSEIDEKQLPGRIGNVRSKH